VNCAIYFLYHWTGKSDYMVSTTALCCYMDISVSRFVDMIRGAKSTYSVNKLKEWDQ
jgi:hypothetical protein